MTRLTEKDLTRLIGRSHRAQRAIDLISEKSWQAQVVELAVLFGWRRYHTLRSKGSDSGFPDLVMVRAGRLIVVELKKEGEEPTWQQEQWLKAFREVANVEVFVWHPSDLGEVKKVLR